MRARSAEALHRSAQHPGADLSAAPAGDPDVHYRCDPGGHDAVDVDPDRNAAEAEVGDFEIGMLASVISYISRFISIICSGVPPW